MHPGLLGAVAALWHAMAVVGMCCVVLPLCVHNDLSELPQRFAYCNASVESCKANLIDWADRDFVAATVAAARLQLGECMSYLRAAPRVLASWVKCCCCCCGMLPATDC